MYNGLFGDLPAAGSDNADGGETRDKEVSRPSQPKKKAPAAPLLFVPQQAKRRRAQQQSTRKKLPPKVAFPSTDGVEKEQPPKCESSIVWQNDISVCRKPTESIEDKSSDMKVQPDLPSESKEKEQATLLGTQRSALFSDTLASQRNIPLTNSVLDDERFHQAIEEAKEDPYDPMVPNDLLQYRKMQAIASEKQRLLEERDAAIRDQELMRRRIEDERTELEKKGDLDKIVEHHMQRGMGRGRGGMSNLPAWVVAQQQKSGKGR